MKPAQRLIAVAEATVDLAKTKDEVEQIRKRMRELQAKMTKEKESGKSDSVIGSLQKQWKSLQASVVDAWKKYDQKHGTRYHQAYA